MTFLFLVFSGLLAGSPGEPGEGQVPWEDLFKWGEYDSLISVLEPPRSEGRADSLLGALASREDSLQEARAWLYLGVAYWAKGHPEAGLEAFQVAARLDGSLQLDPLYSTPEMAARFDQLTAAGRPKADSAAVAADSGGQREAGRPEPPSLPARKTEWRRMAVAALAGAAAVGGFVGSYYLIEYLQRPRIKVMPVP